MNIIEQWEEAERKLDVDDKTSKERDHLVGRYIRESAADGYAIYIVYEVSNGIAYLTHFDAGDAWTIPMIESMGLEVPLKYVKENIAQRDAWDALFDKHQSGGS